MTKKEAAILSQWIEKAEHDLIAAENLIGVRPLILDIACFHCQQAIEKLLKAYLVCKKQEVPKVHNIDFLLKQCAKFDADYLEIDVKEINIYAVRVRYPHDSIMPSTKEAREYYKIALEVKNWC